MSRFEKLAHVLWHCQYHIVWVPKYRYRVLRDRIKEEVRKTLIIQSERLGCQIVELNIQEDHVHLLIKVPPKIAISVLMSTLKGKTAMRVFNKFPELKQRPSLKIRETEWCDWHDSQLAGGSPVFAL